MRHHKFLLCFMAVLTVTFGQDQPSSPENLAQTFNVTVDMIEDCLQESPIQNLINFKPKAIIEIFLPENRLLIQDLNCFQACIYEKSGKMVDSKLVTDVLMEYSIQNIINSREELQAHLKNCYDKVQDIEDECDKWTTFECCINIAREIKISLQ